MLKIAFVASSVILAEYWCTYSHFPCLLHQCREGENSRWSQRKENEEMDFPSLSCGDGKNKSIAWPDSPLSASSFSLCSLKGGWYTHWDGWVRNVWMSFDCTLLATGFRNSFHHLGICRIDSVIERIRRGPHTIDLPLLWCGGWNWFWQGAYKTILPLHEQTRIFKLDLLILN